MSRPTVHDVAKIANVSLATVDRVLNNRGGVAQKSLKKVHAAIEQTGYVRDISAANLSRRREYRFAFILPDTASGFVGLLRAELNAEQKRLHQDKVQIEIIETRAFDTASQVAALRALSAKNTDGVAMIAAQSTEVQTEIKRLRAENVSVLTLVSDLPLSERNAYVGPDNVAAGRTAAAFLGRFVRATSGTVLMVAGSLSARDHMERVMGFRATMAERFPHLTLLPAAQGFDSAQTVEKLVKNARETTPLVGVYSVGAGSRGMLRALSGSAPRPVTIVHELTDNTRAALQSEDIDLVIDQNPAAEVRAAVSLMRDLSDKRQVDLTRGTIPLNIFVRENV